MGIEIPHCPNQPSCQPEVVYSRDLLFWFHWKFQQVGLNGHSEEGGFGREELHTEVWFTGCQGVNDGKGHFLIWRKSEKLNFTIDVSFAVAKVWWKCNRNFHRARSNEKVGFNRPRKHRILIDCQVGCSKANYKTTLIISVFDNRIHKCLA